MRARVGEGGLSGEGALERILLVSSEGLVYGTRVEGLGSFACSYLIPVQLRLLMGLWKSIPKLLELTLAQKETWRPSQLSPSSDGQRNRSKEVKRFVQSFPVSVGDKNESQGLQAQPQTLYLTLPKRHST